jgi:UDP-N-acetyl-D-galactosamine dehydrogenase
MKSKVLVMGATFKEDVSDIRNSKVVDVINELKSYSVTVDVVDPHADSEEFQHEYGFALAEKPSNDYDAVIVAVNHKEYLNLDENYFKSLMSEQPVLVDIKGIYRNKFNNLTYWAL